MKSEQITKQAVRNAHILSTVEELARAAANNEAAHKNNTSGRMLSYKWQAEELTEMMLECVAGGVDNYGDLPM